MTRYVLKVEAIPNYHLDVVGTNKEDALSLVADMFVRTEDIPALIDVVDVAVVEVKGGVTGAVLSKMMAGEIRRVASGG